MDNDHIIGNINTKKIHHSELILSGISTQCCDCGMPLTDAVSIERSIGPVCSKKGYLEDPVVDANFMDAFIYISEYPELIKFLNDNYSSEGNRGFMNGLVKVCSLNRSNKELVKSCCMAIEMLGWEKLANAIRNSCVILTIKNCKSNPDFFEVYLKNAYYKIEWSRHVNQISGSKFLNYPQKHNLVPKSQKEALWIAMVSVYSGECVKGPEGIFRIQK